MIIVRMCLHSAIDRSRDQTLVKIQISNMGTGTLTRGNYAYKIMGRKGQLLKEGKVVNWPRQAKTACALLQRVINDAYPNGAD